MQIHLDEEQLLCMQVCMQNAPAPYDISKKQIVQSIVEMIGEPPKIEVEPLRMPKYCLLYTSPSPRDVEESRMPSSA